MELFEVTDRVLLVLPVGPFLLGAESTPKPVLHLLQKSVIRLREAKPVVVIHSVDLLLRQGTGERAWRHSIRENLGGAKACPPRCLDSSSSLRGFASWVTAGFFPGLS